jgi:hypothetical protein
MCWFLSSSGITINYTNYLQKCRFFLPNLIPYPTVLFLYVYNKGLMVRTVDGSALCVTVVIQRVRREVAGEELAGQIVDH